MPHQRVLHRAPICPGLGVQSRFCVLVLGDKHSWRYKDALPKAIEDIATRAVGGYSVVLRQSDTIPDLRRVRKDCRGSVAETVLVLRNERGT